jgi:acyl-CoA dehydrogenase
MTVDQETFALLKDTVTKFVNERLVPNENRVEEEDEVPAELIAEMRDLGLYGISIPEEYGGIGLSLAQEAELAVELGQTALAFRSAIGTNVGIGSQGILMDGTEAQKRAYLPKIASGEYVFSFALTEPEAGSDAASLRTTAVLEPDGVHYLLNGTKRYITNAVRASGFTLMARTDPANKGAGGISSFILPRESPGITLAKVDKKMGQRGTKTCDVILENVRVPAANIIGGVPGQGFKTAMKVLDRGRIHISAVAVGMGKRLLRDAVQYAASRKQFGSRIGEFQLIQGMLADMQTELYAAETMVRDVAQRYDAKDKEVPMLAACTKYFCTEMVGRLADKAVQIHGGAGYMAEYKVERFYRDVRLLRLYEGTSQIQQVVIGRALLRGA